MHLQGYTLFDIRPWPWVQGHRQCCPVPSTSCDLYICDIWRCYVQGLRRRCIYKKIHHLTWHEMFLRYVYTMWSMHLQNCSCYVQRFRRRCIYKMHSSHTYVRTHTRTHAHTYAHTHDRTDRKIAGRLTSFGTKLIYFFSKEKKRGIIK